MQTNPNGDMFQFCVCVVKFLANKLEADVNALADCGDNPKLLAAQD